MKASYTPPIENLDNRVLVCETKIVAARGDKSIERGSTGHGPVHKDPSHGIGGCRGANRGGCGRGYGGARGTYGKGMAGTMSFWQGPLLGSKLHRDVTLKDNEAGLGLELQFAGGHPIVDAVDAKTEAGQTAKLGDCLLRVNGLDTSILTEQQIRSLLAERPLKLRFGES